MTQVLRWRSQYVVSVRGDPMVLGLTASICMVLISILATGSLSMLVVISDLHLTDGSNGVGLDPGALELFAPRMAELALRASWRRDGRYRPLERIDLLLLGDVLDFTRSRRWLETLSRPWSALNA
jgi:hypothetical protein